MGNVCCQTDVENSPLESDIPKVSEYFEATLPHNDGYLQQWMHENNFNVSPHEHDQVKSMKHRDYDRYYYGKWDNGVPEGRGLLYEPGKLLFNGDFHKGLPEGRANIKFIDQLCEYEGQLKQGRAHGNGTIDNLKQKYRFAGEWEESKPKKGVLTFTSDPNISNIEIEDFKSGAAIITYKDGRKYEGHINTNRLVPSGKGKVTFPSNSNKLSYEGDWYNGVMHGKGKFQYADGSSYEGDYLNGKKQGSGTFIFPNGSYYEGFFLGGKQDGAGTLYSKNKEELKKGSWKNGVFETPLNKDQWARQSRLAEEKVSKLKQNVQQEFKKQEEQQKQKLELSKKSAYSSAHKNQIHKSQQKYIDHSQRGPGDQGSAHQPYAESNMQNFTNQSKAKVESNAQHIGSQNKAKAVSYVQHINSPKVQSNVEQHMNSQNNKVQSNVQHINNQARQKAQEVKMSIKKDSQFGYPTF